MLGAQFKLEHRIGRMLDEAPKQYIIKLATRLRANRTYLAGYLQVLEDDQVTSRKIGTAKVY